MGIPLTLGPMSYSHEKITPYSRDYDLAGERKTEVNLKSNL